VANLRWGTALVLLLASLLAAAPLTRAAPAPQGAIEVRMIEFAFQPQTVTINVGQAVTWTNTGSVNHTTTSTNQVANDPCCWDVTVPPGQVFERVFTQPGTFTYYCRLHQAQGMTATIIVQQQATATPTATATPGPATPTGGPTLTPTATPLPTGQPAFFILSPTEGQTISGSTVQVQLDVSNITLRPPGTPNRPGEGMFSLFLDNLPEVRTGERTYTFTGVPVGDHTLRVELRQNDGTPFTPPIQATVRFRTTAAEPPPPMVTGVATTIPTATAGLPRTGDGSYRDGGGSPPFWLIATAPLALLGAALLYRARRGRPGEP
jgi:plastocyanin